MKLTLMLEVLRTLERRERNVISDSPFVVQGARRNAEALSKAYEIIDNFAVTELLTPPTEPEVRIEISQVPTNLEVLRPDLEAAQPTIFFNQHCTRRHNCASSPDPCNGISRSDAAQVAATCTCTNGLPSRLSTRCLICNKQIKAGVRL